MAGTMYGISAADKTALADPAMPAPSEDPSLSGGDLLPGTMVGEYCIDRKLGQGGMATVFAATHPLIGKRVAIKVMNPWLSDPMAIPRFIQEARAVNQIGHPNIVDVFAFGSLADGRCYFVMELLEGMTLSHRLREGALPVAEAVAILLQVCEALDAAHRHGVVHRDLKPENIFLTRRSRQQHVKLLDFGVAKLVGENITMPRHTGSGSLVGTPCYMSPEQARGENVGPQSDIYAFGVTAFETVLGRLPFDADNMMDVLAMQLSEQPPPPSALWPEVPPALERLMLELLAKEPWLRPPLGEVAERLRDLARELGPPPELPRTPPSLEAGVRGNAPTETGMEPAVTSRRATPTQPVPVPPAATATTATAPTISAASVPVKAEGGAPAEAPAPIVEAKSGEAVPAVEVPSGEHNEVTEMVGRPLRRVRNLMVGAAMLVLCCAAIFAGLSQRRPSRTDRAHAAAEADASAIALAVSPPPAESVAPAAPIAPVPPPAPVESAAPPAAAPSPGQLILDINVPAARVELDGKVVAAGVRRADLPVEPGEHELVVTAPDNQPFRRKVVMTAGGRVEMAVLLVQQPRPATPPARRPARPDRSRDSTVDPFKLP